MHSNHAHAPCGHSKLLAAEIAVSRKVLETLDTPVSLGVFLRIKYAEEVDPNLWVDIVKASVCADHYLTVESFADDYLAVSLLRKSPNLPTGINRKAAALDSHRRGEADCLIANKRLHEDARVAERPTWWTRFIRSVRSICGPLDESVLTTITSEMRITGGKVVGMDTFCGYTSGSRPKRITGITQSGKFRKPLSVTKELLPFAETLIGDRHDFTVVEGEQFSSVPKNAETERGISPQPTVNSYLQSGIGTYLRRRLLIFGCDIRDQRHNQTLAALADDLDLCTIDLSNASNLINREMCRQSLFWKWYCLLNVASCDRIELRLPTGNVVENLERFCSMGNGFTFPLETILFLSVLRAVVPTSEHDLISAYGDDLICPRKYYEDVVAALEYLGLQVNQKKSFHKGRFFESCGTDWFQGVNVRPIFLDRDTPFNTGIPYYLQIANAIRSYAKRRGLRLHNTCDIRFKRPWLFCVARIPKLWNHPVPASFGDVGLIQEEPSNLQRSPQGWVAVTHVACDSVVSNVVDDVARVISALAAMRIDSQNELRRIGKTYAVLVNEVFERIEDVSLATLGVETGQPFADVIRNIYGRPLTKKSYVPSWDRGWEWL